MALATVLLLAAGIGTDVGLQDPGFDLQFAIPVSDQSPAVAPEQPLQKPGEEPAVITTTGEAWVLAPTQIASRDVTVAQARRVSAQFSSAKASEVFDWLQKQGVDFVVADGLIPSDARVTLNVSDKPVDSVLEAIGAALGGHWEQRGGIRVFQKGAGFMAMPGFPGRTEGAIAMPPGQFKEFMLDEKSMAKQFGPDFQKKMLEMSKDMEKRFGPEFQEKMKRVAEEAAKNGDRNVYINKDGKVETFKLKPGESFYFRDGKPLTKEEAAKVRIEVEKAQGEALKAHGEALRALEEAHVHGQLSKEQAAKVRTEVAKAMEEAHKAMSEARVYSLKDGKLQAEIARAHEQGARARINGDRAVRAYTLENGKLRSLRGDVILRQGRMHSSENMEKLVNTLTPDQKFQMRTRGFVFYLDLTQEQKKMLGEVPKGHFELKYKVNDQDLVIRN